MKLKRKSKLLLASTVLILTTFVLPSLAQAGTATTNGVITTVAGPDEVTVNQPFTINITFETSGNTALYAHQYPGLTAPTALDLSNVTYNSTATSPQYPESNYTLSGTAQFNQSGVTRLYSRWTHGGYCPELGFGDKITWDYTSFVASQPGQYTFTVAVSGLFWSAEEGTSMIDPANPVTVTHTVSVHKEAVLPGDVNSDGKVDVCDLTIVGRAFGSRPGDSNWDSRADLNGDNQVNIFDMVIVGRNFGKSL